MATKSRIEKELDIQEKIEGITENTRLVRGLLAHLETTSEFLTLVHVNFHRYGTLSYEAHRFYSINPRFLNILNKSLLLGE